jgi:tetratricopeptide (TPR) repeat protein
MNKGNSLCSLGRVAEGEECYQKAAGIQPDDPQIWFAWGNGLYSARTKFDVALKKFERYLTMVPNDPRAWTSKGLCFLQLERCPEALQTLDHAIQMTPQNPVAIGGRAETFFRMNRFPEALRGFDEALSLAPEMLPALFGKGRTLCNMNRFAEGVDVLKKFVQMAPPGDDRVASARSLIATHDVLKHRLAPSNPTLPASPAAAPDQTTAARTRNLRKKFDE